jgi:hypothetical protein
MKLAVAGDADIVVASTMTVTLRCPLSQTRLGLPCRGRPCDHIQCFDASTFLKVGCVKNTFLFLSLVRVLLPCVPRFLAIHPCKDE